MEKREKNFETKIYETHLCPDFDRIFLNFKGNILELLCVSYKLSRPQGTLQATKYFKNT
jgi:hypothetical protein